MCETYWNLMFICQVESTLKEIITAPQGGFIAPHVWEIVGRNNLTIFKSCQYPRFYIMISSSFPKIETKNLNSDPRNLIFPVLETKSPAAH